VCFLALLSTTLVAQPASVIAVYKNAPSPVRHAVDRLSAYTGLLLGKVTANASTLRVELNTTKDPKIEPQGYTIRSTNGTISVSGNDAEGAANGVYTLLRTLMIEHRKDPFSREWTVEEKPAFTLRSMQVAPYRYGASYGFAQLSPDRWSFQQWKDYVDFMRLCNMTTLAMGSTRMYDPQYPNSRREQFRYEIWKQVMDYGHQIGMKFDWFMMPNLVPEQAFWDNPDKRYINEHGAWYGNGLDWNKGKDLILKTQKYTMEYFHDLDSLILMYSDGGSFFFDSREGSSDPTAAFGDVTNSYLQMLHEAGNHASFVNMNWGLQLWADLTIPKLSTMPIRSTGRCRTTPFLCFPRTPGGKMLGSYLDSQLRHLYQGRRQSARQRKSAGGQGARLPPRDRPFLVHEPEGSINMFPHPYIQRAIQEARYARDEIGADGAKGYRLDPPMRFMDDYVFFRVASDPSLTQEQLVNELAGLLTEKEGDEATVREAINTLEQFWTTRKLEDIEKVDRLFAKY